MWAPPTTLLSKSMEQIHVRFVIHMSNATGFVKVTLTECCHFHMIVQLYKILHHLVPTYLAFICLKRMLLGMFVETVISCLFLE